MHELRFAGITVSATQVTTKHLHVATRQAQDGTGGEHKKVGARLPLQLE